MFGTLPDLTGNVDTVLQQGHQADGLNGIRVFAARASTLDL